MKVLNEEIRRLLDEGFSLRGVASKLKISYGQCRARAVKFCDFQPRPKKVLEGKATCLQCDQNLELHKFPRLFTEGKYICDSCFVANNHAYQIKKVGCSEPRYQQLLESQEGSCAICGKDHGHIGKNGRRATLAVDHDHETGLIRGLLCNKCNRGLGYLGEENLAKALEYCQGRRERKAD